MIRPEKLAAALILAAFFFLALAMLTSCVAVPVPPFGNRLGEAGTLHIRTSVRFEPRLTEAEAANQDLWHALGEFQKTLPALKDK